MREWPCNFGRRITEYIADNDLTENGEEASKEPEALSGIC